MSARPGLAVPAPAARLLAPLAAEARRRGLALYAVGGCVRDWLLGRPTLDLDLAVAGDPDPIARVCGRLVGGRPEPFGRFGTRRVVGPRWRVDVAATRTEAYPEPAALPVVAATGVPIEQDLLRRDFTINSLAARLDDGSRALADPCGGLRDLKARMVRVLHADSFRDDPTRVFRAARFLGRFRFRPAPGLVARARAALKAGHAARLSRRRLLHELVCLLGEKDPRPAFALLARWGYLSLFHPKFPARAALPPGVEPRLAALALALGPEKGRDFADSFPFERRFRVRLHEALALAFSDKAPRAAPDSLALAAARRALPRLPLAALKPCFLRGEDLIKAALKPGPSFHRILDEAARLQRAGRLKSRAAALAWLRADAPHKRGWNQLENPSGKG
ncbi:MAG: CCA tRNA nucleotidyltransferase [Elusimicrobia bacterium]|nr:CCA tRNA nucleotidyltransferase [Elusimicrobiota bacterium]